MSRANCNGVMLNYHCVGEGPDVVLIHGLAANHAFWRLNVLLSLRKKYRVTIYDLRGHGYSEMPREGYTSAHMAEDLHHLLENLSIKKAHLVGHSVGGVIALHYASLHPERVQSLVIADSRVRAIQPPDFAKNQLVVQRLQELGLQVPDNEAEPGLWFLEHIGTEEWQAMKTKLDGSSLLVAFDGWSGGKTAAECWLKLMNTTAAKKELVAVAGLTRDRISTIRKPVYALYGQLSTTLPSLWGLRECLPDLMHTIVPEAGHFHPVSRPYIFAEAVNKFLDGLGSSRDAIKHRRPHLKVSSNS